MRKWKTISTKIVFDHKWYKVRRDKVEVGPGKIYDDYFMGIFPDIVLIVAVTKDRRLPLVYQYKHGAGKLLVEVPAGYITRNEAPLAAAKRELLEETGFTSKKWTKLGFFYSNPTKEKGNGIYIYLAKEARQTKEPKTDEMEDIKIQIVKTDEALRMIKNNKIKVAGSAAALLLALRFLKNKKPAD